MPTAFREQRRLEACSSEPIRTPGSVQPHGVFLALERSSGLVRIVSENSGRLLGVEPSSVLGRPLDALVGPDAIIALRNDASGLSSTQVSINGANFDAIVHEDGPLTFVEFEAVVEAPDRTGEAAAYAAAHRLGSTQSRIDLLRASAEVFSELTGFDRVMVYHFYPDGHGEVVAEVRAEGMEQYLGLHFPASDIPAQARDLYLTKLSRAIVSTSEETVPLVGDRDAMPDVLDLSAAELRSVSPFHLQFMRNMGQASTVSFSLIYRGELIGMITCAHRTPRRITYFVRRRLEVLANRVAIQLGAHQEITALREDILHRDRRAQLLGKIVASDDIAGAVLDGDFTVLDVIAADAAVLRLEGMVSTSAGAPDSALLDSVLHELDSSAEFVASESLGTDYPAIAEVLPEFAGLVYIPIGTSGDYLALLRREVIQTIDWLGDLTASNRLETLSPRLSFSSWRQSVTGRSLPWEGLAAEAVKLSSDIDGALHRRNESQLATLALRDPLTGLGNRRFLLEELARFASRKASLALIFVDLDAFKPVNDNFGHEAGDLVIAEVGRRLLAGSRSEDCVVRLGGDEFVVVCAHAARDEAERVAQRIAEAIARPISLSGGLTTAITASLGIAVYEEAFAPSEMLASADAAMYRAKQSGRNRVSF